MRISSNTLFNVLFFVSGLLVGGIYVAHDYQEVLQESQSVALEAQDTIRACLCSLVEVEPVVQSVWTGWVAVDEMTRTRLRCND